MTKQEKIQEAYGKHWETVKNLVDHNGWVNLLETTIPNPRNGIEGLKMETLNEYHPKYCYYKRAKSIGGIEDNNGWTKIESYEDLPKVDNWYFTISKGRENHIDCEFFTENRKWTWEHFVTHFQPIKKPKPPIY